MNVETWFAVLQALPDAINTPLVLFDNPIQAFAWMQLNMIEPDAVWVITQDECQYWVVDPEVGSQLTRQGFVRITSTRLPVLPPVSAVPGDGTV